MSLGATHIERLRSIERWKAWRLASEELDMGEHGDQISHGVAIALEELDPESILARDHWRRLEREGER